MVEESLRVLHDVALLALGYASLEHLGIVESGPNRCKYRIAQRMQFIRPPVHLQGYAGWLRID